MFGMFTIGAASGSRSGLTERRRDSEDPDSISVKG